jgi:hypothetical protein
MKFQFQIDGRRAGPLRDAWVDAAHDAVSNGYASWRGHELALDETQGAAIARLPCPTADASVPPGTREERGGQFMAGLAELTAHTGISVHGCGCCGSPFLVDQLGDGQMPGAYEHKIDKEGLAENIGWKAHKPAEE